MAAQINVEEIVESIASETRMPKETVSELYEKTLAEYRDGARILDYVALLAAKRVRDDLRQQQKRH
ncbi:DUF3562 domain-containing protein [Burkholderia gladioli]|uniref:DUF3562 domain-containing protein n=1 Tax=Burkholderia gladioli (strain BSR3) TaxID=999541 RepID=F2LDL5_BURGS|nr:DUF3562 domain-containing protein [Burkholderia gladioli]AEA60595.1 hypothetical protein bgla_1g19560 [Burkholderia gladioli BSR3]MBW5284337.1 DUF3562 domain-containing protein [Burkholderia gladioli]NHH79827.1 hypothetical protein [Burkholderia gladioli]CAG9197679.1 conserved hypothetical protein [Burkholderia gladioli]